MNEQIDLSKTGVYAITNTCNGKIYVGSAAVSFKKRWSDHRAKLNHGKHNNRHLQGTWKQYGADNFEFSVLMVCEPADCVQWEQVFINSLNSANDDKGYNISPIAGSQRGMKHSAESKAKMSSAQRGRKMPPKSAETLEKMAAAQRGKIASEETRKKLSLVHLGRKRSETTRARMSAAFKLRVLSAESRAKISATLTGRTGAKRSDVTRERISEALKGRTFSESHRAKISQAAKERMSRPEMKAIIAESNRRRALKKAGAA